MKPTMWSLAYWKSTAELAVRAAASGAVLAIGADRLDVFHAHWPTVGGFALGAAVLSVLGSLGATPFGQGASPLVTAAPAAHADPAAPRTKTVILKP